MCVYLCIWLYVRTYTIDVEQFTLGRTTRKTRQQEHMIWQRSSTGDLAPTPTFRYVRIDGVDNNGSYISECQNMFPF